MRTQRLGGPIRPLDQKVLELHNDRTDLHFGQLAVLDEVLADPRGRSLPG